MKNCLIILFSVFLLSCSAENPFERGPFKNEGAFEVELNKAYFNQNVAPLLKTDCQYCHKHKTTFDDYDSILERVVLEAPEKSILYVRAISDHGTKWDVDSENEQTLRAWIMGASLP